MDLPVRARALLGWAPVQLQGRPRPSTWSIPLDLDRIDGPAHVLLRRRARRTTTSPAWCALATGGYREVTRAHAGRFSTPHGSVTGAVVTVTDTHDRDSALRALTTLSQANRALVRATDEADLLAADVRDHRRAPGATCSPGTAGPSTTPSSRSCPSPPAPATHQGYLDEIQRLLGRQPAGPRARPAGASAPGRPRSRTTSRPTPDYQPWLERRHPARLPVARSSLPVIVDGDLDGVLMVYAAEAGAFDALAQDLLEDLAADLGYGLERLRGSRTSCARRRGSPQHRERLQSTLDSHPRPVRHPRGRPRRDRARWSICATRWRTTAASPTTGSRARSSSAPRVLDPLPRTAASTRPMRAVLRGRSRPASRSILDDYTYGPRCRRRGATLRHPGRPERRRRRPDLARRHGPAPRRAGTSPTASTATGCSPRTPPTWSCCRTTRRTCSWVSASARADPRLGAGRSGRPPRDRVHPPRRPPPACDDAVARSTADRRRSTRVRYRWRRPDGSYRWVESAGRTHQPTTARRRPAGSSRCATSTPQVRAEQRARRPRGALPPARRERLRRRLAGQTRRHPRLASPSVTRVLGWAPEDLHRHRRHGPRAPRRPRAGDGAAPSEVLAGPAERGRVPHAARATARPDGWR